VPSKGREQLQKEQEQQVRNKQNHWTAKTTPTQHHNTEEKKRSNNYLIKQSPGSHDHALIKQARSNFQSIDTPFPREDFNLLHNNLLSNFPLASLRLQFRLFFMK
jgi:hypothetical protein